MRNDTLKPWVREELVPFDPKKPILLAANHYKDAQAAWDAWTIPDEMLCALVKTNSSRSDLVRCSCDLASVALKILRARHFDAGIFRIGIATAKIWADKPSSKILDYVSKIIVEIKEVMSIVDKPLGARYAAWTLFKAVRSAEGSRPILEIPFLAQRAIIAAMNSTVDGLPLPKRLLPGIDNDRLNEQTIRAWQCKRIRKFFPERPVYRAPENPELRDQTVPTLFGQLLPPIIIR